MTTFVAVLTITGSLVLFCAAFVDFRTLYLSLLWHRGRRPMR